MKRLVRVHEENSYDQKAKNNAKAGINWMNAGIMVFDYSYEAAMQYT